MHQVGAHALSFSHLLSLAMPFLLTRWLGPRKSVLKMLFQAWAMAMMRTAIEAQQIENVRLGEKLGKKKNSLWSLNKQELMDKAMKDLGMTPAQMENETVTSLRERLRSQKEVMDMMEDPLAKPPKGLDSLTKAELQQELLLREIPEPVKCTRPKMIVLIRDDVARRITMENCPRVKLPEDPAFKDAESDEEVVKVSTRRARKK